MLDLIAHLHALGNGKIQPMNFEEGLCQEIKNKFGYEALHHVHYFAPTWEHYSGNELFPVPDPDGLTPAQIRYYKTRNLWAGSYGKLRKDLCIYIAKKLEKLYV